MEVGSKEQAAAARQGRRARRARGGSRREQRYPAQLCI